MRITDTATTPTPSISGHLAGCPWQDDLEELLESLSSIDLSKDVFDESAHLQAHGGFCDIFMAKSRRHGNMTVAVKRLRFHIFGDKNISKIVLRELKIWSSLRHPNVLPLLGYVMHDKYPAFVSQWMINGTVRGYLEANPEIRVLMMAEGIAEGLRYLHEMDVVHSDLKTDNVLISNSGAPLLADFGISRLMTTMTATTSTAGVNGSARWMAIELLTTNLDDDPLGASSGLHTKATDVWAYGMVIYELVTGSVPFSMLRNDLQVAMAIVNGQTPSAPPSLNVDNADDNLLWKFCRSCWERSPSERPTMKSICDTFTMSAVSAVSAPSQSTSIDSNLEFVYSTTFKATDDVNAWRRWAEYQRNSPPVSPFRWTDSEVGHSTKNASGQLEQGMEQELITAGQRNRPAGACQRCKNLKVRCEYSPDDPFVCHRCALGGWDCLRPGRKVSGKATRSAIAIGFENALSD